MVTDFAFLPEKVAGQDRAFMVLAGDVGAWPVGWSSP